MIIHAPVDDLWAALESIADPERADDMAAYMKHHFRFLGVQAADRRTASRPWLRAAKTASRADLVETAQALWAEEEREFHYVGMDLLRAGANRLEPVDLPAIRGLVEATPWWDTVDSLAAWTVGPMVRNHPELVDDIDKWIQDPNLWIARVAILHQLGYKHDTDVERLFRYCDIQAEHPDFFIRKAIGWALRQYARIDGDTVGEWVSANQNRLAGLTIREATKHLG